MREEEHLSFWDGTPEIATWAPAVSVREKPVLYLADGREVIVKKPVGFAGHPAVPPLNRRTP